MIVRCNRRTFLHTAAGVVGLGSLSGYVGTFGAESGEPIRLGAMLPVSGSLEQVGVHGRRVAKQAVKDINGAGGMLDQSVELITMDTEGSASVATDGYAPLADASVIGLVDDLASDVSLVLAPETADDAVMEMSPVGMNPRLSNAGQADGQKFFGRTIPSDSLQAAAVTKILDVSQYTDADRIVLLTVDGVFGSDLGTALGDQLDAKTVTEVSYDPNAEAFGGVIDEVLADSPDAIGFVSVSGQEQGVLDAYGVFGHGIPWVFLAGLLDDEILPCYEGFHSAPLSSARADGYFHLTQRFSDIASLQSYAANAYDVLFLMATTAEYTGEASGPAIADTLQTVLGETGHTVPVGKFDRIRTLVDASRELNCQNVSSGVDLTEVLEPLSSYLVERAHNGSVEQVELPQRQSSESGDGR